VSKVHVGAMHLYYHAMKANAETSKYHHTSQQWSRFKCSETNFKTFIQALDCC